MQRALDQVGIVVEIAVRIFGTRNLGKSRCGIGGVTDDGGRPGVGMKLGTVQILLDQFLASLTNRGVVQCRAGIEAHVSRSLKEAKIGERLASGGNLRDVFEVGANRPGGDGQRECVDHAHPRLRSVCRQPGASGFDGFPYCDCPQSDFRRGDHGAGHS